MQLYSVIRFHKTEPDKVMHAGLTLGEAQEICEDQDTSGENWFYGYSKEK